MTNGYKIAIVSLTIPCFPGKSGGELRDWNILKHIAENHRVDFYSLHGLPPNNLKDNQLISCCCNLYFPQKIAEQYPDLIEKESLQHWDNLFLKRINQLFNKYPGEISNFLLTFNLYIRRLLQKRLYEEEYDFLIVTPQINPAFVTGLEIPTRCKRIFATYDVEKVRYHQLYKIQRPLARKLYYRMETRKACRYENKVVSNVDGIIAVSNLDKQLFIKEYNVAEERVLCLENGVDSGYISNFRSEKTHGKAKNLVYVGNMGYPPNKQAVNYFISDIFPRILHDHPDACFWIVGANAGEDVKRLHNGDTVVVAGEVPDVREYWSMADVVCIPLLTGSGTKLKILEALASEKAIVTTSVGAEGLAVKNKEHLLIEDEPERFAQAVTECLTFKERSSAMAKAGKLFAISNHDWSVIVPKIDPWLDRIYELPRCK